MTYAQDTHNQHFEERQQTWLTNIDLIVKQNTNLCRQLCTENIHCNAYRYVNENSKYKTNEPNACWLYRYAEFSPQPADAKLHYNIGIQVHSHSKKFFLRLHNTWLNNSNVTILYHLKEKYGSYFACEGACAKTEKCQSYSWHDNGECYLWQGLDAHTGRPIHNTWPWHSGYKPCPDRYIYGGHSLHPECYLFDTNEPRTWQQASQECKKDGSQLVSIECQEEHDFVSNYYLHKATRSRVWPKNNCIFPFTYGGINFTTCIFSSEIYNGTQSFCATTNVINDNQTEVCSNLQGFWTSGHYLMKKKLVDLCIEVRQVRPYPEPSQIKQDSNEADCDYARNFVCEAETTLLPEDIFYNLTRFTGYMKEYDNRLPPNRQADKKNSNEDLYYIILVIIPIVGITVSVILVLYKRKQKTKETKPPPLPAYNLQMRMSSISESLYEEIDKRPQSLYDNNSIIRKCKEDEERMQHQSYDYTDTESMQDSCRDPVPKIKCDYVTPIQLYVNVD